MGQARRRGRVSVLETVGRAQATTQTRKRAQAVRGCCVKGSVGASSSGVWAALLLLIAASLVRVKVKFAVKNAVYESLRRQHPGNLTVNLALSRTRGLALKSKPTLESQSQITVKNSVYGCASRLHMGVVTVNWLWLARVEPPLEQVHS